MGRMVGFFTGWINFFGWMFDLAALIQITANITVKMYATYHPQYVQQLWQTYITYVLITWLCAATVIFANRLLPRTQDAGMFFVIAGGIITIIVLAAMPKNHALSHFVWGSFTENNLGWSGGVAFLCGEIPRPKRDLPKAVALQLGLGFLYAFCLAIALCYAITDINALLSGINGYQLAMIYSQATGSAGGTFGLLFIIFLFIYPLHSGHRMSRSFCALARDNAMPFSFPFGRVSEDLSRPVYATLLCALAATGLGAIPLGSTFLDLTGSFVILSTVSYAIPFTPNILTGRKYLPQGSFRLGKAGYFVNRTAVVLITLFNIFYCFPYSVPTTAMSMNSTA
ncbi:hypothetical protein V1525DRAFT_410145 [Lipomyces kononenkoae]|uniref:Uncharacterized protein n=1 Tax=Lipomyces kononenkoae TaxID=34357 RepID=A0ACC3SUP4_LIPKO